jgi:aspartate/methionine/tyrosine aminotransferase
MAGWRVGVLCANEQRVNEVLRFKSNMDSGMFLPVQLAAAKALSLDESWYQSVNKIYKERREHVYTLLNALNCTYSTEQNGLFVWARIPSAYTNAYDFSDEILYNSNVFITPGGIFGSNGDNYIRVSLCATSEKIKEAIGRVEERLVIRK